MGKTLPAAQSVRLPWWQHCTEIDNAVFQEHFPKEINLNQQDKLWSAASTTKEEWVLLSGLWFCSVHRYVFRRLSLTHSLTHSFIPRSRVLLHTLIGFQLVKKFSAFYRTRRFITAFTSVRLLSQSWASSIQSVCPHPTSWRSALILSSHLSLGLPSGLFPSGFPTKTLYTPLSSPIRPSYPAQLILDFTTRSILG